MPLPDNHLYTLFDEAFATFVRSEYQNILHDVSERMLCARLSLVLSIKLNELKFDGYYADVEFNRKQNGEVKAIMDGNEKIIPIVPDLIVHSRGELGIDDNLIAVEMKKIYRKLVDKEKDRERLKIMTLPSYGNQLWGWNGHHPDYVCGYKIGVYIVLDRTKNRCKVEYYEQGHMTGWKYHEILAGPEDPGFTFTST